MTKTCRECGVEILNAHFNQVKCVDCRKYLNKYIKSNLTSEQIEIAKSLIGKKTRFEIAKIVGCSVSNLKRALRGVRIINLKEYDDKTIKEVCEYYNFNSLSDTEKKFPHVKVRSIVERKKAKKYLIPKCEKWKDSDFYELAKMSGLISYDDQARFFNRPRANSGSIQSVWTKRFKISSTYSINGIKKNTIKKFLKSSFVPLRVSTKIKGKNHIYLCLYCDLENNLNENAPEFLNKAVSACARFQRWLHEAKNNKECKEKVLKMIKQRGE